MFQSSINAFYCSSTNPFSLKENCYAGVNLIYSFLGLSNLVWIIVMNFFYSLNYYNRNPFSESVLTCSSNWWSLGSFIMKVGPTLFFVYDPTIQSQVIYVIIMNMCSLVYTLGFRYLFVYYHYNFQIEKVMLFIEAFTCLFNFSFISVIFFQNK